MLLNITRKSLLQPSISGEGLAISIQRCDYYLFIRQLLCFILQYSVRGCLLIKFRYRAFFLVHVSFSRDFPSFSIFVKEICLYFSYVQFSCLFILAAVCHWNMLNFFFPMLVYGGKASLLISLRLRSETHL